MPKGQLADKTYQLDKAALAKSMIIAADGSVQLKGPIVIEPGTSGESKQTLEMRRALRGRQGHPRRPQDAIHLVAKNRVRVRVQVEQSST
jgi:hypothetical protein